MMTCLFAYLGVILTLVTSSYSLSCIACLSPSGPSCSGPSATCNPGYQCGATYTKTTQGSSTISLYVMSCVPQSRCTHRGSISTNGASAKTVVSCCNTDNCIPILPDLPGDSSTPNGMICRACISTDSLSCYASDTIECMGDENMCLFQTIHAVSGSNSLSTAIRGCSTKSFCDIGSYTDSSDGISADIKNTCDSESTSLSCTTCISSLTSCSGPSVTCDPGSVCGAIYTEITIGSTTTNAYVMSCLPPSKCDQSGSYSTIGERIKSATSCCLTDNCVPTLPVLPRGETTLNGITCPSCMSPNSKWCYTSDTIKCTGSENICFLQTLGSSSAVSVIRGCSTKSLCDYGSQTISIDGLSTNIEFFCTDRSRALSCTNCISESTSCSGPSVTCASDEVCGAIYTTITMGYSTQRSYVMSCFPQNKCTLKGSISKNGARIKTVASCCITDNCIPTLPDLPEDNSTSNGLTCRSCTSPNSLWCYTSETIQCTGNENMCLLQTTQYSGSKTISTALRGCSTKSFCDFGSQSYTAGGISTNIKFICTDGSPGLHKGFYLPAVICLFFLFLI